jgi:hypothetical protein
MYVSSGLVEHQPTFDPARGKSAAVKPRVREMSDFVSWAFDRKPGSLRATLIGMYCFLIAANGLAWIWALTLFQHNSIFLGTAVLACALAFGSMSLRRITFFFIATCFHR